MPKDINFVDEQNSNFGKNRHSEQSGSGSKMVDFLIRKGIAKTPGQANIILVVTILVCIAIIVYLNSGDATSAPAAVEESASLFLPAA